LLNRLLTNDLELFINLVIKLYLGTPETSLCLQICTEKHFMT